MTKRTANRSSSKDANQVPPDFDPDIRRWFQTQFKRPTDIQAQAWPIIARQQHALITAPTGSGKTLTAFLWALNQLIQGTWTPGVTRVLYVSPLKALNNDIQKNLIEPLKSLEAYFESVGRQLPKIRVQTRSGDTPAAERQRMLRQPPEILITTPESLNLLLASRNGASNLNAIQTVILDEIHALVESKRGVFLMSAVERLALEAGEFQRIALSATVNPLSDVAKFVGGYQLTGDLNTPTYHSRTVEIVQSTTEKIYDLTTCYPDEAVDLAPDETIWEPVAKECKRRLTDNRSTLIFTNNRALCEKLTLLINSGEPELIAYAHHGSLSREIRLDVEQRLKAGKLKAIVATSSLELGIDIGDLDEVLLIQCPGSVASTLQRMGRAGHRVGEISRARLITTHPRDFLAATAMLHAVEERVIEPCQLVRAPLDLLPQIIVGMLGTGTWQREELFHALRSCEAYHSLTARHFDLVLDMMLGKFADTRVRELKPLIGLDSQTHQLSLRQGTLQRFYLNGGVIPNRGYYHLRHTESQARIGELDEEYVWEAAVGQTLTLGTQHWKIDRITHNDVFVSAANPKAPGIPFWRAEDLNRSFHFSERIGRYLEEMNDIVLDKKAKEKMASMTQADQATLDALAQHLKRQRLHTERDLPHRHHLLVEMTSTGPGAVPGNQVILHTLWGGQLNRPYAMALSAAWNQRFGHPIEIHPNNDCVALVLPNEIDPDELIGMVTAENVEALLRNELESSGFFAARFRECAGRALLISKRRFNERMPLWMSRLRAQKLFDAVARHPDFPITLETWRTCLQDEFDLPSLIDRLGEIAVGTIRWSEVRTHQPSPMARSVAWRQVNEYVYRPDASSSQKNKPSLHQTLIEEILHNESLRPQIPQTLIDQFVQKRQRLAPGYSPDTESELIEWLKERVVISEDEWRALLKSMERDHEWTSANATDSLTQVIRMRVTSQSPFLVAHETNLSQVQRGLWPQKAIQQSRLTRSLDWESVPDAPPLDSGPSTDSDPDTVLLDYLRFHGPLSIETLAKVIGATSSDLETKLAAWVDSGQIIRGHLSEGVAAPEYCDAENLEILLRMKRQAGQAHLAPLPSPMLQFFLASHQGIGPLKQSQSDSLAAHLNQLLLYPAPCQLWETEILPARWDHYQLSTLDLALQDTSLVWAGTSPEVIQFTYPEERQLGAGPTAADDTPCVLPDSHAKYDFESLRATLDETTSTLWGKLWKQTWAGMISNDRFSVIRDGILNRFQQAAQPPTATEASQITRRHAHHRRSLRRPRIAAGNWFRLPELLAPAEGIEFEELKKDRVRILLDRYGILFRELLWKESDAFQWRSLFRTLRLMEFSGELVSGYFFENIPGPQFTSPRIVRHLTALTDCDTVYWLNAADPISLAGIAVPALRPQHPKRLASTHLVFAGTELILISEKNGKRLQIKRPPNDAQLAEAFGFLRHLLNRSFQPIDRITIEEINDAPAITSDYLELLRTQFELIVEPARVSIYRPVEH